MEGVFDVLEKLFGKCREIDIYCFGRFFFVVKEDRIRFFVIDIEKNVYIWRFFFGNLIVYVVWRVFYDYVEILFKNIRNSRIWNFIVLRGILLRVY